jgi:hypothetical protein
MTGGLRRAGRFLLHPFLRETFARLGGTPGLPADAVTPTVNRLRKIRQREPAFDLRSERERKVLADLIVKAVRLNGIVDIQLGAVWSNRSAGLPFGQPVASYAGCCAGVVCAALLPLPL